MQWQVSNSEMHLGLFWPNEAGDVFVANTGGVLDPKDGGVLSGVRGDEEPAEPVNSYLVISNHKLS